MSQDLAYSSLLPALRSRHLVQGPRRSDDRASRRLPSQRMPRNERPAAMPNVTIAADYIGQRLAQECVNHYRGVAGDSLFPICGAVERSTALKWIGCANE